jgi:hypothetical protein
MPVFVIDSVDFEHSFGSVPVIGRIKAHAINQEVTVDIEATLTAQAMRDIHEIVLSDLKKHWENMFTATPGNYTYAPLDVSRSSGVSR